MPDDTPSDSKGPKGEKRREQILVASALAGVVLTFILLRRSSGGTQAQAPVTSPPIGNTGTSAGGPSSVDMTALATMLGRTSSPTGISATPDHAQYTSQDVRDIFASYGFSSDAQIAGATFSPSLETGQQRVDRITRALNQGHKTYDQEVASISQLPGSPAAKTDSSSFPRVGQAAG